MTALGWLLVASAIINTVALIVITAFSLDLD